MASVVLPTRDRARLLPRAIESVLAQTLPDWELIVVDDGSADETPDRVARYAHRDGRVRLVRREETEGAAAARNRGIARARGRYVALLDDDDEWLPGKLERQCALLDGRPAEVGLAYCPYVYVGPDARRRLHGTVDASGRDARRLLLRGNFVGNSTVLVRREALEEVGGFDETLPRLQDYDLWLRLSSRVGFAFVPVPLVRVHYSGASISTRPGALVAASRAVVRKVAEAGATRAELADLHYALGHELLAHGAPEAGKASLRRAVRLRPWPPRRIAMAGVATLGEGAYRLARGLHGGLRRMAPGARIPADEVAP